jgi:hypothetical protein
MRSRFAISLWLVLGTVLNAQAARAECISRPAKDVLADPQAELVFSGTVTTVKRTAELGYRATFAVDRVWKGTVPSVFDVYVWEMTPETERFRERMHAVVVARKIVDPRIRAGAGLQSDNEVAFMPTPCNAGLFVTWDKVGSLGQAWVPDAVAPLEKHDDWVLVVARQMLAIQPGMTRADLEKVFVEQQGGFRPVGHRSATFLSRACQYFQVEVQFGPEATGSGQDVITKISPPYVRDGVVID